jgi:hypothetical protein
MERTCAVAASMPPNAEMLWVAFDAALASSDARSFGMAKYAAVTYAAAVTP